eukprot:6251502-Prymnesium_polylepis.1
MTRGARERFRSTQDEIIAAVATEGRGETNYEWRPGVDGRRERERGAEEPSEVGRGGDGAGGDGVRGR